MTRPCKSGAYSVDEAPIYGRVKKEDCEISPKGMLVCSCFTDFCSTDLQKMKVHVPTQKKSDSKMESVFE
ncbi:hypothetical protein TELCIR_05148 [Teladorsagia circumcincta]|uniref:Uncharacterized protein n=1 Tax=Teladorsagia circumcincta TaxID=45464 RepID=A0A2G9URL3_TELCI|nr:hypothetical protein TELCIR_05148 [Teladorsagia circumcincta]